MSELKVPMFPEQAQHVSDTISKFIDFQKKFEEILARISDESNSIRIMVVGIIIKLKTFIEKMEHVLLTAATHFDFDDLMTAISSNTALLENSLLHLSRLGTPEFDIVAYEQSLILFKHDLL